MSKHLGHINLWEAKKRAEKLKKLRRRHEILFFTFTVICISLLSSLAFLLSQTKGATVDFSVSIAGADVCGDAVVDDGEFCDDGTALNGEPNQCDTLCDQYTPAVCGNGTVEADPYGSEQCDDGGVVSGDGCSDVCQTEESGDGGDSGSSGSSGGGSGPPVDLPFLDPDPDDEIIDPDDDTDVIEEETQEELEEDVIPEEKLEEVKVELKEDVVVEPKVTLNAAEVQERIPVLKTNRPVFRGSTGVPFATVRLALHSETNITTVISADGNGDWQWVVEQSIEDGPHELFVEIFNQSGTRILKREFVIRFIVNTQAEADQLVETIEKLTTYDENTKQAIEELFNFSEKFSLESLGKFIVFDIAVSSYPEYQSKEVMEFNLAVNKYDLSNPEPVDLIFSIYSDAGELFYQDRQAHILNKPLTVINKSIPKGILKAGKYQVVVQLPYRDVTAVTSDEFRVVGRNNLSILGLIDIDPISSLRLIVTLLILFLLLMYLEYAYLGRLGRLDHGITSKDLKKLNYFT